MASRAGTTLALPMVFTSLQARLDAGERPHFLPETARIRQSDWKVRGGVAPILPHGLSTTRCMAAPWQPIVVMMPGSLPTGHCSVVLASAVLAVCRCFRDMSSTP